MEDRRFLCVAIDYLIQERNSMDAVFFKGFVLKYGLGVYGKPSLNVARECLDRAARSGNGSAALELREFDMHSTLEAIQSIHIGNDKWYIDQPEKREKGQT